MPSFTPSSTPELDALFYDFRDKVFIPDSLSPTHRHLLYSREKDTVLTNEPGVTVTIAEDEEIKLLPQEYQERPNKRKSYSKIRTLLTDNEDNVAWQNLFPFMHGLTKSTAWAPHVFCEQVIKLGVRQGKSQHIVKLFDQPSKTGFSLRRPALARALMYAYHERAEAVNFKGDEFDRIVGETNHIASLMEHADHCGAVTDTTDTTDPKYDSRRSLLTIGLLLELTAAKSINTGAKDPDGQVSDYLAKALALSETGIADGTTPNIWRSPLDNDESQTRFGERTELRVLLNALEMAAEVEGIPNASQRAALASRLSTIANRTKYIEERMRQLFEERQQKRAGKDSS